MHDLAHGQQKCERRVSFGDFEEGLGRLVFVAGPLEHLRPLLCLLFAWASAGPRFARPRLPTMLLLLMEFMPGQLKRVHTVGCRVSSEELGELFRLDA